MQAGIVGAGIMGRLLALALHNEGWQVTLFDKNAEDDNCSQVASGLLTPISELDKADLLIHHLGQESIKTHWPSILEQLPEPIYFRQAGSLVLSHPKDQAEWKYFSQRIAHKLNSCTDFCQQLSQQALIQLEPTLTKFESGYYFPDEAQIDSQALLPAVKNYLLANGVKFLNTKVQSLKPRLIVTEALTHQFDVVFDCRGLGAQGTFSDLRALRGELIWLHAPQVQIFRPIRFLHPRYSVYLVPRPGDIYLIGASEIEAEDYSSISVRTTLELLTAVYYVHAGFAEARILKTVTHCRPTLSNHLPRIQSTDGLIAINGLYRHGYLIAPALAEEVLRKLNKQPIHYPNLWESAYDHNLLQ